MRQQEIGKGVSSKLIRVSMIALFQIIWSNYQHWIKDNFMIQLCSCHPLNVVVFRYHQVPGAFNPLCPVHYCFLEFI